MSSQPPGISSLCRKYILPLFLVNIVLGNSGGLAAAESSSGYVHGQSVPISCLNRDIETGEHVCTTDSTGKLQYIPFPTCNETSAPLSFRYGISETITCTILSLPDPLYHLLEYYVHADVPLTCRVPTFPLVASSAPGGPTKSPDRKPHNDKTGSEGGNGSEEEIPRNNGLSSSASQPPFTPLTIALQGTLQLSHLHIWTDMNVLMHQSAQLSTVGSGSSSKKSEKSKKGKTKGEGKKRDREHNKEMDAILMFPRGQIVAGSAYSMPMVVDATTADDYDVEDWVAYVKQQRKERDMLMDPWAAEGGMKVIRGEPLVFTFRVGWVSSGDVLGLVHAEESLSKSTALMAAGGGLVYAAGVYLAFGLELDSVWL
ncbi:predicted protein [Histoplasma mississippiense (nom. inval.)]|uniref:predicted protein n=1 Tax=Ajellomyces capsulatus (strain NAm1 / WU24) TaxID=2059318 RepID=UPI000157D3B4|nr:predicted protein [Histoplasma mississippiense (nom. inval.)]EDN04537.1 predicted protein [Histoplasma mississippiense (nom. inval.)]